MLATQNPIEQEGTYPLPEAQLDRFLLQVDVGYPDLDAERDHAAGYDRGGRGTRSQAMTAEELIGAQALIRRVPVGESVLNAILRLVRGGRPDSAQDDMVAQACRLGPGPARLPGADAGLPAAPCSKGARPERR